MPEQQGPEYKSTGCRNLRQDFVMRKLLNSFKCFVQFFKRCLKLKGVCKFASKRDGSNTLNAQWQQWELCKTFSVDLFLAVNFVRGQMAEPLLRYYPQR